MEGCTDGLESTQTKLSTDRQWMERIDLSSWLTIPGACHIFASDIRKIGCAEYAYMFKIPNWPKFQIGGDGDEEDVHRFPSLNDEVTDEAFVNCSPGDPQCMFVT